MFATSFSRWKFADMIGITRNRIAAVNWKLINLSIYVYVRAENMYVLLCILFIRICWAPANSLHATHTEAANRNRFVP